MTAPARTGGGASPKPGRSAKPRERALRAVPPERRRSAAVERAYARRAQRTSPRRGPAVTRQSAPAPKAPFVVMVMVVLGVGIAAIMWLSTQATADSYRLQDARAEETRLARQVEQLRREVAMAESPLELAAAAAKLGMLPAGDPAWLRQLPDGTVEVHGTPSAVEPPPPPSTSSAPPTTTAAQQTTTPPASGQQPTSGQPPASGQQTEQSVPGGQ
ncbi:hypothetical protein [Saccharothrix syringae]|uniref:Septum formation initiator family protein n=1 Tax=Saccharothrix syringae TaxID=103733 RepID=A0A5Q0H8N9_SACSY|nr:hypothetical protein [Saccharothrix syringae]QFZ22587.1 hypothetical protein EKG83_38795 [Saccharothrix syringae]